MRKILWVLVFLLPLNPNIFGQNTSYDTNAGNEGLRNTSFGYYAGYSITGMENLFGGYSAGRYTTDEDFNAFWGYYSGNQNSTGSMNTYFGAKAGMSGSSSTYNTTVGFYAGLYSTASRNVLLGKDAKRMNSSGERNVIIGYASGYNSSGSNNIFLGYKAGYSESGSNILAIENTASTSPLIYGEFDNDIVTINGRLGVGSSDIPESISLLVDGLIIAKEVEVIPETFPDYVFEEDYNLILLSDLEKHIEIHGQLPGLMSREEVIEKGVDTGTLSMKLLEKVEELTLYLIELNSDLNKEEQQQQRLLNLLSDLQINCNKPQLK